jgi:hypothetical protein
MAGGKVLSPRHTEWVEPTGGLSAGPMMNSAKPITSPPQFAMAGFAEPVIGRAFARPVGSADLTQSNFK